MELVKEKCINWLVVPKLLYFWRGMTVASTNMLASLDYVNVWGMSYSSVGYLMAIQGINFISSIFWSRLTDKYGYHKEILFTATLIQSMLFFVTGIPKIFHMVFEPEMEFLYLCLTQLVFCIFQTAMFPLLDMCIVTYLSETPNLDKSMLGRQKLFECPSRSIAAIIAGYTYMAGHYQKTYYHLSAFLSSFVFSMLILFTLPKISVMSQERTQNKDNVYKLILDGKFMSFMFFVLSIGLLSSTMACFQSIYAQGTGEDKSPLRSAGTTMPAAAAEAFAFYISSTLVNTFGYYWVLIMSQLMNITRTFSYTFTNDSNIVWMPYVLEIIKGLNAGLVKLCCIRIASDMAIPGTEGMAQGMFNGVYHGVAPLLAGISTGLILSAIDNNLRTLFYILSLFSILTTIVFFVKYYFVDKIMPSPFKKCCNGTEGITLINNDMHFLNDHYGIEYML